MRRNTGNLGHTRFWAELSSLEGAQAKTGGVWPGHVWHAWGGRGEISNPIVPNTTRRSHFYTMQRIGLRQTLVRRHFDKILLKISPTRDKDRD